MPRTGSTSDSTDPVDPKDPEHKKISAASEWCLFQSAGSIGTGGGGIGIGDIETSRTSGIEAIQHYYPRARFDCPDMSKDYCVDFVPPEKGEGGSGVTFEARAAVRVPMYMLFGDSIPIKISDSRTWEGEFAR